MIERIEAIPGVSSATLSRHPLLGFSRRADSVTIEGVTDSRRCRRRGERRRAGLLRHDGDSAAARTPVRGSRQCSGGEVAVVNEQFAAAYLAGANPIGHRLWFGDAAGSTPIEIVGMTRDAKYTDLRSPASPTVYVPFQQDVPGQVTFAVRTVGEAAGARARGAQRRTRARRDAAAVRHPVAGRTGEQSLARETMFARLSTLFGLIALLLAAIGLYGTMAYAVAQRTAEIGLRMALGARRATVVDMVVRQALVLAAIGVAVGAALSFGATRLAGTVLDGILFGLEQHDPLVMGSAAAFLALVAVAAALVPARAAARVDPLIALRHE